MRVSYVLATVSLEGIPSKTMTLSARYVAMMKSCSTTNAVFLAWRMYLHRHTERTRHFMIVLYCSFVSAAERISGHYVVDMHDHKLTPNHRKTRFDDDDLQLGLKMAAKAHCINCFLSICCTS